MTLIRLIARFVDKQRTLVPAQDKAEELPCIREIRETPVSVLGVYQTVMKNEYSDLTRTKHTVSKKSRQSSRPWC